MKKDNKGFSLVELIIVIAIMAILVGIVGSQVLPYLNKSREAKDQQILSGWVTAALSAYSSNAADLTDNSYTIFIGDNNSATDKFVAKKATVASGTKKEVLENSFNELAKCENVGFTSTLYNTATKCEILVTPQGTTDGFVVTVKTFDVNTSKGSVSTSELVAK